VTSQLRVPAAKSRPLCNTTNKLSQSELATVTETDAVFVAGGPGYQPHFYPGVYPSLAEILDAGTPVYPLGPGWKGHREDKYEFTESSKKMLRRVYDQIEFGGARDLPTKRVVESIGVDNIRLTGCPAWYDLNRTQEQFTPPESIDSLVVSSPSKGSYQYGPQWVYLMYELSKEFPDADKYCSFHQGVGHIQGYNTKSIAAYNNIIVRIARKLGFEILDMAGNPDLLELYRDIDLHVGYRVHAHIPFIANGQGLGVSESLHTVSGDVTGFGKTAIKTPIDAVMRNIRRNVRTEFSDFTEVDNAINNTKPKMVELIKSLP
jgi:hypothetical protein